jgi:hypothetical protein
MKFKTGEYVKLKHGFGVVIRVLPNPYASWLIKPKYLVESDGVKGIYKQRELRKWKIRQNLILYSITMER